MDEEYGTEEDWTINLIGVWGDLYKILKPVLCFRLEVETWRDRETETRDRPRAQFAPGTSI